MSTIETITIGEYVIQRSVSGITNPRPVICYSVWCKIADGEFLDAPFGTVSSLGLNNGMYGKLTSHFRREAFAHLPVGAARTFACKMYWEVKARLAYALIAQAFPGIDGERDDGDVRVILK